MNPTGSTKLCLQCGYDLRGLPAEGVCPECQFAIERSLSLRRPGEERAYLGRVARGTVVLIAALALLAAGMLLSLGELIWEESGVLTVASLFAYAGLMVLPVGWLLVSTSPCWTRAPGEAASAWLVTVLGGMSFGAGVLVGYLLVLEWFCDYQSKPVWVKDYGGVVIAGSIVLAALNWIAGFKFLAGLSGSVLRSRGVSKACWLTALLPLPVVGIVFIMPFVLGFLTVPLMWLCGLGVLVALRRRVTIITRPVQRADAR